MDKKYLKQLHALNIPFSICLLITLLIVGWIREEWKHYGLRRSCIFWSHFSLHVMKRFVREIPEMSSWMSAALRTSMTRCDWGTLGGELLSCPLPVSRAHQGSMRNRLSHTLWHRNQSELCTDWWRSLCRSLCRSTACISGGGSIMARNTLGNYFPWNSLHSLCSSLCTCFELHTKETLLHILLIFTRSSDLHVSRSRMLLSSIFASDRSISAKRKTIERILSLRLIAGELIQPHPVLSSTRELTGAFEKRNYHFCSNVMRITLYKSTAKRTKRFHPLLSCMYQWVSAKQHRPCHFVEIKLRWLQIPARMTQYIFTAKAFKSPCNETAPD